MNGREQTTVITPSKHLDFTEIPVLDVGPLITGERQDECIEALRAACSEVGFFYIRNHQVSISLISDLKSAASKFFCTSTDEKMALAITPQIQGYLPLGYRSYEGEEIAGTSHQEGFWIGHERPTSAEYPLDGPNQWPEQHPSLKVTMLRYFAEIECLADVLLRGFSMALGLEGDHLLQYFKKPLSRLKVNHYPPQRSPVREDNLGVVPHADSGGFTILWQDEIGGLEVQNKNGEWVGAPPVADTFVINIGNIMETWSNGLFSSTPHRVINCGDNDRYSIPLFVNPSADVTIAPLIGDTEAIEAFHYGTYQRDLWRNTFPVANIV